MCLLVVNLYEYPHIPVVLAANRDEFYERPSEPPQLLNTEPRVVGGRDGRAGGTWLGVNEYGLMVALTNRRSSARPCDHCPSRGLLCATALRHGSAAEAAGHLVSHASQTRYNPFTLLAIDPRQAWVVGNYPEWSAARLAPGWHVLGNSFIDDGQDVRVQRAHTLLRAGDARNETELIALLKSLCRDHGTDGAGGCEDTLCMHGHDAGTRSASIVLLGADRSVHTYIHADGRPCRTRFQSVEIPWQNR